MPNQTVAILGGGAAAIIALGFWYKKRRRYDLKGKTAVVTGGSRGLGLVLTRQLVQQGASVALCAGNETELGRVRREFRQADPDVMTFRCDLAKRHEAERFIASVERRFGKIDLLVNNAGIISVGSVDVMDTGEFEKALENNFWSAFYTTSAALPAMRKRREGRIVNIVSIGGKISMPHLLPYNVSKFALAGFSEGLGAELGKDGIHVTTVYPGLMRTGSPVNAEFKGRHRKEFTWFSLSDALPLISIDARRAARQIIAAAKSGKPVIHLSIAAKVGARLKGLFPGFTLRALSAVNRMLPKPGGIGSRSKKGYESFSRVSPSKLTVLNDRAALRNNEISQDDLKRTG